jgi:hypothetical protein
MGDPTDERRKMALRSFYPGDNVGVISIQWFK